MTNKKSESSKAAVDNRADQLNPTHPAYHLSRGATPSEAEQRAEEARGSMDTPQPPKEPVKS